MRFILIPVLLLLFCASAQAQQSKRDVLKEFSFWLNASGAAGDLISSAFVIDGVTIREGNPILARGGKVAWERAIPIKGLVVYLPTLFYEKNPGQARFLMYVGGIVQWVITVHNAFIKRPSSNAERRSAQFKFSFNF